MKIKNLPFKNSGMTTTRFSYSPNLFIWLGRVSQRNLTSAWKQLRTKRIFKSFRSELEVLKKVVYLEKSMGLKINEENRKELVTQQSLGRRNFCRKLLKS